MNNTHETLSQPRLQRWMAATTRFIRGGRPAPENRWSKAFVFNLVGGTGLFFLILITGFGSMYSIGINVQSVKCLPGALFISSHHFVENDEIQRGKIYWYRSKGLAPLLPDGVPIGKLMAGLPGDQVDVDKDGIRINGVLWGPLNDHVLSTIGKTADEITRSFVIAPDEVLLLGTLPRSLDARYLGPIKASRIEGQSWRVF